MSKSIVIQVRDELRAIGVVKSEAEFCKDWLGRGEGYLRTLRFTQGQPSAAALVFCAGRLERLAAHVADSLTDDGVYWSQHFSLLARKCRAEMERNVLAWRDAGENPQLQLIADQYLQNLVVSLPTPCAGTV